MSGQRQNKSLSNQPGYSRARRQSSDLPSGSVRNDFPLPLRSSSGLTFAGVFLERMNSSSRRNTPINSRSTKGTATSKVFRPDFRFHRAFVAFAPTGCKAISCGPECQACYAIQTNFNPKYPYYCLSSYCKSRSPATSSLNGKGSPLLSAGRHAPRPAIRVAEDRVPIFIHAGRGAARFSVLPGRGKYRIQSKKANHQHTKKRNRKENRVPTRLQICLQHLLPPLKQTMESSAEN